MASKIDAASADPPSAIQPHRILSERGLSVYDVWAIRSRVERCSMAERWERIRLAGIENRRLEGRPGARKTKTGSA
jgi:hypothetical protein